ncbi:MFS transporter [Solitalea longa]|uniref:MFS transporter n=1 Tax=Solitalea longa TaxID=2079460 RepID=A0A2S5A8E2_9SPHI|nr:MDR family MFS transporter [Solitalea longa]POY38373.1 MFS transporter [Solitalea longa]
MKNKYVILSTLMIGTLMGSLDSSIVNVSLPIIRKDFNCRMDEIQWVVTAYMLSFSLFMPLTSWLKDRIGFFNLYVGGLAVFTLASLLCGISTDLTTLVGARVIQAIGGGSLPPTAMAIMSTVFPKEERGKALGWWGMGSVVGPTIGPTLGGFLTREFGWHSIFLINLPISVIAIGMCFYSLGFLRQVPKKYVKFDFKGFVSLTAFLILIQLVLVRMEQAGILSFETLGVLILLIASFIFFIRVEKKAESPIINLRLFKNRRFVSCILVTIARSAALFGGLFLAPFLLQGLLKYNELQSGLILFPGALLMGALMPFSGTLADRYGSRGLTMSGLVIVAISMLQFSMLGAESVLATILLAVCLRGIGLGLLITPVSSATVNSVKLEQVSMASSINSLLLQVGGSLGIAMLTFIHQNVYNHKIELGLSTVEAEQFALNRGFTVSMILVLLALIPASKIPAKNIVTAKKEHHDI